jgi:hypothetical protein
MEPTGVRGGGVRRQPTFFCLKGLNHDSSPPATCRPLPPRRTVILPPRGRVRLLHRARLSPSWHFRRRRLRRPRFSAWVLLLVVVVPRSRRRPAAHPDRRDEIDDDDDDDEIDRYDRDVRHRAAALCASRIDVDAVRRPGGGRLLRLGRNRSQRDNRASDRRHGRRRWWVLPFLR